MPHEQVTTKELEYSGSAHKTIFPVYRFTPQYVAASVCSCPKGVLGTDRGAAMFYRPLLKAYSTKQNTDFTC